MLKASRKALENNLGGMERKVEKAEQKEASNISKELDMQRQKYLEYIKNKLETWNSEFLHNMYDRLMVRCELLTPNMISALDRMIQQDKDREKPQEPVDESKLPKFTFKMKQWWIKENNLESRIISGVVLRETARAYQVKGYADMIEGTYCMRCGKELTEPASMLIGLGETCAEKVGIPYPTEILSASKATRLAYRKKLLKVLHKQTFEAWVPKSQIVEIIKLEG